MSKSQKPWVGADRMKVRTYGTWPHGTWTQIEPKWIRAVRVTPRLGEGHPSGGLPAEVEIVFEMEEPQEAGGRHSLVLDFENAYRLAGMLNELCDALGAVHPRLASGEDRSVE